MYPTPYIGVDNDCPDDDLEAREFGPSGFGVTPQLDQATRAALEEVRQAELAGLIPHCRHCGLVDAGQHFGNDLSLPLCDRCFAACAVSRVGPVLMRDVLNAHVARRTA